MGGKRDRKILEAWFRGYDSITAKHGIRTSAKKKVDGSRDEEIQGLAVRTDRERTTWFGLSVTKRARLMLANFGLLGTRAPLVRCV